MDKVSGKTNSFRPELFRGILVYLCVIKRPVLEKVAGFYKFQPYWADSVPASPLHTIVCCIFDNSQINLSVRQLRFQEYRSSTSMWRKIYPKF